MNGTVYIGDGSKLSTINWNTRRLLVEKFGDIDSGSIKFKYNKTNVSSNGTSVAQTSAIESSGTVSLNLVIDGNNIPID
jgi:hypothetical protein